MTLLRNVSLLIGVVVWGGCDVVSADDAGRSDGGEPVDAGTVGDAGLTDAGGVDAGEPHDAGDVDAGEPDAGSLTDAGRVERDPLADAGPTQRIDGGFTFTEGPLWVAARGVLYFSDVQANRLWQYTPPGERSFVTLRQNTGGGNGLGLNAAGELLTCEGGNHRLSLRRADGGVSTFVETSADGGALDSPNDLIIRSDGTVYFTDFSASRPAVYRVSPAGQVSLITNTLQRPNGVVLSTDEQTLYVADLMANELWMYPVNADGSVGSGRRFADTTAGGGGGGGDGVCVDDDGNLYVATTPGIKVFRPDGGHRGTLVFAERPANCSFGDVDRRTLYVTARTGLYRVRLGVPGLP